ncbi:MAG TPA: hypothetical protein VFJ97_08135 [Dermatophilaceae bacterium]|nr:hypothetical protein [Dermatophilaceae bacterium]
MKPAIKVILATCVAVPSLTLSGPAAVAGGNGTYTFTQTEHGRVGVVRNVNVCTGDRVIVRTVTNSVFHVTVTKNGLHFAGAAERTMTLTPLDPSKVTYEGHSTVTFVNAFNNRTTAVSETYNITARGSDGSHLKFHQTAHATADADGVVTVDFDRQWCGSA